MIQALNIYNLIARQIQMSQVLKTIKIVFANGEQSHRVKDQSMNKEEIWTDKAHKGGDFLNFGRGVEFGVFVERHGMDTFLYCDYQWVLRKEQ
mmetsp:Transcript_4353/g.16410  ORF Transcript_4353/g.16410 Transcript_4353/m.16410 type:complete len:93 (-) Transcript_4353:154-432(-)